MSTADSASVGSDLRGPATAGQAKGRPSRRDHSPITTLLTYVLLISAVVVVLVPLGWILLTSFKTNVDASAYPPKFFNFQATFQNYVDVVASTTFLQDLVNTVAVTAGSVVLTVVVATMAAYALVRLRAPFKRWLIALIVLLQVVPGIVLIIPLYQMVNAVNLYDTWLALILIYGGINVPFATWVLVAFVQGIPLELEEAALVDGASRLQVLRLIVAPLLAPGMATAALFSGIAAWNQFLIPVILSQSNAQTLTVYVTNFAGSRGTNFGGLAAAAVIIMLPIVLFAIFQQRHLVRGLLMGSER